MDLSEQVQGHIANAHDAVDERGLVPLPRARALVQAASEFRKGDGQMIDETFVLESDRLWAALLSLEDADEFVREATRLRWFFHARGRDDTSLLDRYGDAILPWLLSRIDEHGRLLDIPMCVVPCLCAIGGQEVFDALWQVRTVENGVGTEWPGPFAADNPGDADKREGVNLDGPVPDEPDDSANGLIVDFLLANPVVGYGSLAKLAEGGDTRAKFILYRMAVGSPRQVFGHAKEALGEEAARKAFETAEIPTELIAVCVLQGIYVWTLDGPWPVFVDPEARPYHALRLVAYRERDSDTWLVVFERLEGHGTDDLCVHQFVMHSEQGRGEFELWPDFAYDEKEASGPAGDVPLSGQTVFADVLHRYLAEHPRAFWTDASAIAENFGLSDGQYDVIADTDRFEHLLGKEAPPVDDPYDDAWRTNPDQSAMWQSLSEAIAKREPSKLEPGEPNTAYELHAAHQPPPPSE